MRKILLAGGYDTRNLGDYAALYLLKNYLQDAEIVLLSRHPENAIPDFPYLKQIKNLDFNSKKESLGKWFRGFNPEDSTEHLGIIFREMMSSNALLIGGGRLLVDYALDFMRGPLFYFFILVLLAKFMGKPVAIYSMTIEKPRTEEGFKFLKFIIENAEVVTLRESESLNTLLSLGIKPKEAFVFPDPGFSLPEVSENVGKEILNRELIPEEKFIGVNFRATVVGDISFEELVSMYSKICDALYEEFGLPILMVSQMYYGVDNPYYDDRNLHLRVREACKYSDKVFVLKGEYGMFETLSIYKNLSALFSTRRHGIIFAATQKVPVYGITTEDNVLYALKVLGLENNQISLGCDINVDLLCSFDDTNRIINEKLPDLKDKSLGHVKVISELVNSN